MKPTRTRFAPSPTGFLHVGGIRTALFAYLVARQSGGQFVLRLEDTDQKREVKGSAEHLVESLNTLGLEYDEGPDIGGPHGPYRQSERLAMYQTWAQKLIDTGRAYADPYSSEEVQAFREQAQAEKRAFLYRDHRPERPPAWDGSRPLRFRSDPKAYTWHDEVMGDLSTGPEVIDDFILIKSDGYPTYNFAHIVDDAEMQITHVIRGQEFIASQPNYLNLYEALGFDMSPAHERSSELQGDGQDPELISESQRRGKPLLPIFATMPHILAEIGGKKLGKRDGAKDVLDYVREGYLPEALLGFIATLGWNDGTEQEIFTRDELIEKFQLTRVQRSGARFDEKRLLWMNSQWIKRLSLDELYERVSKPTPAAEIAGAIGEASAFPAGAKQDSLAVGAERAETSAPAVSASLDYWPSRARNADEQLKRRVLELAQDRMKLLTDLPALSSYFFERPAANPALIESNKQLKKLSNDELLTLISATHSKLSNVSDWTAANIQSALNELLEETGQKPGTLFSLIRIYTTWAQFSPQLDATLELLGKDEVLARLKS